MNKNRKKMKIHKMYLFAATALVLASCNSADDLGSSSSKGKAISFESPFVSKTSRATGDLTTSNITTTAIKVWGDEYVPVTGEGTIQQSSKVFTKDVANLTYEAGTSSDGKGVWNCDQLAFWESNKKYDFAAVAPSTLTGITYGETSEEAASAEHTLASRTLKISDLPAVQVVNNGETKSGDDVLVATANGLTDTGGKVQLSFKHILSRFNIYLYSSDVENPSDADNVTVKSLSIYLPNNNAKASYTQANHGKVEADKDTWAWSGFTNVENAADASALANSYTEYKLITTATRLTYAASPTEATNNAKETLLAPEFFIAPTAKVAEGTTTDLQLYLAVEYESYKTDWTTRTKKLFVPISDLHSFKQGCQTNLYINLHLYNFTPQPMDFGSMTLDGWSDFEDGEFNVK